MKFEQINKIVKGIPFISEQNARFLYDLILRERCIKILELGIAHGTATCYMAAALDELGRGSIVSVDLLEASDKFHPTAEEQVQRAGLEHLVTIKRMHTGYTWFLHDEIKRLTKNGVCKQEYDLCIIDGPKNWTIDGLSFFLVDKVLNENGLIIFDDYSWTYAEADNRRETTDGIVHRQLSDIERNTPHIREIFELLVKQHPGYCEFLTPDDDWAIARKSQRTPREKTLSKGSPSEAKAFTTLIRNVRRKITTLSKANHA